MKKITAAETVKWLLQNDRYIVVTHKRPDGDTIGSAAALVRALRSIGKTAYLYDNPEITDKYREFSEGLTAGPDYEYSLVVSVDTASRSQFPVGAEDLSGRTDLAIDHHLSNTGYSELLCIEDRAACGEIIYEIAEMLTGGIDADTANCIYAAISTDTGCFAYGNTTYRSLETAAKAAKAGADLPRLNRKLFRTKSRKRAGLEGYLYSHCRYYFGGKAAVMAVTLEMRRDMGLSEDDLDDIASLPIGIEGVEVGITIKEQDDGSKISVRTSAGFDSNEICAAFGGGGHKQAAGCFVAGSPESAEKALIDQIGKVYF